MIRAKLWGIALTEDFPMRRKSQASQATGFTLVEVMIAACVLILTIVGMIQVIVSGSEMLDVARKQTIAMQVIHGQLDNIRLSNWSQVSGLSTPRTVDVDAGDQAGFVF